MAKREYKWRVTVDRTGWERLNPVTDAVEYTYYLPDDDKTRYNLMLAGFKDTILDGGALPAGSTRREREEAMLQTYNSIRGGTWSFRDGRGGGGKLVDAMIFAAVVATGRMADTPTNRKLWADATAGFRAAQLKKPDVLEQYNKMIPTIDDDDDGDFYATVTR